MRQRCPTMVTCAATWLVAVLSGSAGGFAQPASPFVGTWQLNVARSTYRPGPTPMSAVVTVDYTGNVRKSAIESVMPDGARIRTEYAAPEDGKDHPLKGSLTADTVALRRTGPGTIERTDKRRGQIVMLSVIRLSADGRTMTITQKGVTPAGDMVSNTMVFEKR